MTLELNVSENNNLPVSDALRQQIAQAGPISVADYMRQVVQHYYASRDPFGRTGDFTTAPEISQMFGEMIGVWTHRYSITVSWPSL